MGKDHDHIAHLHLFQVNVEDLGAGTAMGNAWQALRQGA